MKNLIPFIFCLLLPTGSLLAQLSISISDSSNLTCHGIPDGTATISISGGTGPYEIAWNDDSLTTDVMAKDLSANRWYRVTVTDASMDESRDSVRLSQPDPIEYELDGLKTIQCHGPAEGYIKISSSGGSGPHSYTWSGEIDSDSDSIFNLTAGKYFFLISDSLNCTANDSLTLSEADKVDIAIDSVFPNPCLGQEKGEIYITPSGGIEPYSYAWTGPFNFTSQLQDITGLQEGMYGLELTDARGCIYERDTSIVDGDPITITHSVSEYGDYNLICSGDDSGVIRIDTAAGNGLDWRNYTYIWTGPEGYKAYTHEISNLNAGNYHLNVFDSANCRSNITVTLTEPPAIYTQYDSLISNPCIDDNNSAIYITPLNGKEPYSYNWTGPNGFTSTTQDITGLSKGIYVVSITDSDGCTSSSETSLEQIDNIDMVLGVSEYGEYNVSCNGSGDGFLKVLSVPGYDDVSGFTFYTTGPDGYTSPFRFMNGIKAGNYHIKISHPLGCSGEKDTTLTQPDAVETSPIEGETEFILDSNYVYSVPDASPGSIYTWSVEGGEIWSGQGSTAVEIEWRSERSGKVKLIEMNENGCWGDTIYLETQYEVISGIIPLSSALNIYPNPVVDVLYLDGLGSARGSIEFYSLLGRMSLKLNLSEELNVESLEKGVYYMRVIDENEQVILTRKIIKK